MYAGGEDVERAATALASRLPWSLAPLARVAYNYRWAWLPGGPELFRTLDPRRWQVTHNNPVRMLEEVAPEKLLHWAADKAFISRIHAMEHALRDVADRGVTICEALATVNGVVDQFHGLANSLSNKQFDTPEPLPCLGPQ